MAQQTMASDFANLAQLQSDFGGKTLTARVTSDQQDILGGKMPARMTSQQDLASGKTLARVTSVRDPPNSSSVSESGKIGFASSSSLDLTTDSEFGGKNTVTGSSISEPDRTSLCSVPLESCQGRTSGGDPVEKNKTTDPVEKEKTGDFVNKGGKASDQVGKVNDKTSDLLDRGSRDSDLVDKGSKNVEVLDRGDRNSDLIDKGGKNSNSLDKTEKRVGSLLGVRTRSASRKLFKDKKIL